LYRNTEASYLFSFVSLVLGYRAHGTDGSVAVLRRGRVSVVERVSVVGRVSVVERVSVVKREG